MASPQPPPRPPQPTLRLSSERYLRAHPETRLLLRGFLRELLLRRPADIPRFAAEYFTQPELPGRIQEELGNGASPGPGNRPRAPAPCRPHGATRPHPPLPALYSA